MATAACTSSVTRAPTASVAPAVETAAVASTNVDAADDPAIWAAPAGGAILKGSKVQGFVAGTDKKAGLYIFDLDGRQLQFLADGLLNNVDLRSDVRVEGRPQVVLGASDRGRMGIALYLFDPAVTDSSNAVRPWGFIKSDLVEPYGFCLARIGAELHALVIGKDGQARQYLVDTAAATPTGREVRRFAIGSQSEGCVADDEAGRLYIGEEARGVWSYALAAEGGSERRLLQGVDAGGRLVADVEGVTLLRESGATYLLVSSQGDSAFAVWRVDGAAPVYAGRFEVSAAAGIDAVTGTDGLDAYGGAIGPFPAGLVIVQDDRNEGMSQNFKLIDWREVKRALRIDG